MIHSGSVGCCVFQDAFSVRQRLLKEAQAVDATKSYIHVMVHADTQGSVDAIQGILHRLPTEDLKIKIVRTSVGDISPTDVDMAVMSKSIVIAFNVKVTTPLAKILNSNAAAWPSPWVKSRLSVFPCADANLTTLSANNVYGLVDMLTATLSQFMPTVMEEEVLGTAEVKQFFPGPRDFDGLSSLLSTRSLRVCHCAAACRHGGWCHCYIWRVYTHCKFPFGPKRQDTL
jgi:hypothetical protein